MTVQELIDQMTAMIQSGEVDSDSKVHVSMNGGEYGSGVATQEVQSRRHGQFDRLVLFLDL